MPQRGKYQAAAGVHENPRENDRERSKRPNLCGNQSRSERWPAGRRSQVPCSPNHPQHQTGIHGIGATQQPWEGEPSPSQFLTEVRHQNPRKDRQKCGLERKMNPEGTSHRDRGEPCQRRQDACVQVPASTDSPTGQATAQRPAFLWIANYGKHDQCGNCGSPADQQQQDEQMQLAGETASLSEKRGLKRPGDGERQDEEDEELVTPQRSHWAAPDPTHVGQFLCVRRRRIAYSSWSVLENSPGFSGTLLHLASCGFQ